MGGDGGGAGHVPAHGGSLLETTSRPAGGVGVGVEAAVAGGLADGG